MVHVGEEQGGGEFGLETSDVFLTSGVLLGLQVFAAAYRLDVTTGMAGPIGRMQLAWKRKALADRMPCSRSIRFTWRAGRDCMRVCALTRAASGGEARGGY